jgi:hypothetical protein
MMNVALKLVQLNYFYWYRAKFASTGEVQKRDREKDG